MPENLSKMKIQESKIKINTFDVTRYEDRDGVFFFSPKQLKLYIKYTLWGDTPVDIIIWQNDTAEIYANTYSIKKSIKFRFDWTDTYFTCNAAWLSGRKLFNPKTKQKVPVAGLGETTLFLINKLTNTIVTHAPVNSGKVGMSCNIVDKNLIIPTYFATKDITYSYADSKTRKTARESFDKNLKENITILLLGGFTDETLKQEVKNNNIFNFVEELRELTHGQSTIDAIFASNLLTLTAVKLSDKLSNEELRAKFPSLFTHTYWYNGSELERIIKRQIIDVRIPVNISHLHLEDTND